ncbi:2,3-bisphosphoglycerate-independent phosphoglycerate mutase [Candidatus Curtissbacteria bacterium]|nr:2,3-bisphosphoglycerate-independent phosphoglycerate mutase [Candidatus Curtissbacteria bacterium]
MLKVFQKPRPLVLCILDGWGIAPDSPGNAISRANLPNFYGYWFSYPHTILQTSGQSVGLPIGHVGNSEVGHLNLGAGRIVYQDLLRINLTIEDGSFFRNEVLLAAIDHANTYNSKVHLIGLVGLGSVHSEMEHLYALLKLLKLSGIDYTRVMLHLFTDGRDSPPTSASVYLAQLTNTLNVAALGRIATVSGRYYAMDRDNRWDRTQKAYLALTANSTRRSNNVLDLIEKFYAAGITDEFIEPTTIVDQNSAPIGPISQNDSVIFFNYRPDRARQLTKAFVQDQLKDTRTSSGDIVKTFERGPKIKNLYFVTLTQYEHGLPVAGVAFKPIEIAIPLARVFSEINRRQLHIAETEKYAHVTYFFNGGRETPFQGEDRILVNSQKVASYDQIPEMSTPQVAQKLLFKINGHYYDFIIVNFANADMVGHTGNFQATVKAVETIDIYLGLVVKSALSKGGAVIITADHGNAEEMINLRTGQINTEHSANPAPCIFVIKELQNKNLQLKRGLLADVAPTILSILQIARPSQMTGRNLLE